MYQGMVLHSPPPLQEIHQNTCRELRMLFLFHSSSLIPSYVGLYIGWRCPHYLWDCFRIGDESKCFCGHLLKEHQIISGRRDLSDTEGLLYSAMSWRERQNMNQGQICIERPGSSRCWLIPHHLHSPRPVGALQREPVQVPHVLFHPITPRGGG